MPLDQNLKIFLLKKHDQNSFILFYWYLAVYFLTSECWLTFNQHIQ